MCLNVLDELNNKLKHISNIDEWKICIHFALLIKKLNENHITQQEFLWGILLIKV